MAIFLLIICFTSSVFAQGTKNPSRGGGLIPLPGAPPADIGLPPVVLPPGEFGTSNQPTCPTFGIFQAPDPTSCSRFILCNNGIARPHNCSEGTHFNIDRGICIDREVANCDLCRFNKRPVAFFPIEGSCSRYVVCFRTNRVERECADGFHFNERTSQCDRRENVQCTQEIGNVPTIACPNTPHVLFLPSLHSCEGYFICAQGSSSFHNCSTGLTFDINTNQCASTGRCLLDYTPLCGQDIEFLPHPYDCRYYFFCSGGQPRIQQCSPGLLFDITARQCNVDTLATCAIPPNESGLPIWPSL